MLIIPHHVKEIEQAVRMVINLLSDTNPTQLVSSLNSLLCTKGGNEDTDL